PARQRSTRSTTYRGSIRSALRVVEMAALAVGKTTRWGFADADVSGSPRQVSAVLGHVGSATGRRTAQEVLLRHVVSGLRSEGWLQRNSAAALPRRLRRRGR